MAENKENSDSGGVKHHLFTFTIFTGLAPCREMKRLFKVHVDLASTDSIICKFNGLITTKPIIQLKHSKFPFPRTKTKIDFICLLHFRGWSSKDKVLRMELISPYLVSTIT